MANKGRYTKKYTVAIANYKKGQSAVEYLITYGWAILLAAISILILYVFVLAPSAIAPNTCSFVYGAYCQDMILGSNSISSKIALFLTNTQHYPIVNPQVSINISNIGTVNGKCLPNYVLPGGAIICNVTMPTTAIFRHACIGQALPECNSMPKWQCNCMLFFAKANLCWQFQFARISLACWYNA